MKKNEYQIPEMESMPVEMQAPIAASDLKVELYPNIWGEEQEW